ncbi:MAG: GIY-YIG nuclease family protein [Anaerolineales bacterium]|jgi:Uri superfamily endonuclease
MDNLPTSPGTYALLLYLPSATTLKVGKLGAFNFPVGEYVYLGSAFNPGGMRARLGRHIRGGGRPKWHIDYLRGVANVYGYHYLIHGYDSTPGKQPLECQWSQAFSVLSEAQFLIPGFGASDCRAGCPAHLVSLQGRAGIYQDDVIRKVLLSHSCSYKLISCYMR